ncbi:MAG: SPOR domain-containing protein, partial [Gammaproteobacteria bacterium]|nr:SPOR domain-containing protein [Gammaproteobacteria bacterium]
MAPILIDTRGLIKLGVLLLLVTVIVFAAGFISGIQQASAFYDVGSETEVLALPSKKSISDSALEQQLPGIVLAGEEIDVDFPKQEIPIPPVAVNSKTKTFDGINTFDDATNKVSTISRQNKTNKVRVSHEDKATKTVLIDKLKIDKFVVDKSAYKKSSTEDNSLLPANLSNVKYSVQVAMYRQFSNAQSMVKILQAKNFNAYVSDYTNRKNETRFNVRFGYFIDKKSALADLKRYSNTSKNDGYLVNFSAKNIVDNAEVAEVAEVA